MMTLREKFQAGAPVVIGCIGCAALCVGFGAYVTGAISEMTWAGMFGAQLVVHLAHITIGKQDMKQYRRDFDAWHTRLETKQRDFIAEMERLGVIVRDYPETRVH